MNEEYFGSIIGNISFYQLPSIEFYSACSSSQTNKVECDLLISHDSTGLRIYSGAHVAIRLLQHYSYLLLNHRTIELGCGVGTFGLIGSRSCRLKSLFLTDGECSALKMAKQNINLMYGDSMCDILNVGNRFNIHSTILKELEFIQCEILLWNKDSEGTSQLIEFNGGQKFDSVIGCELMYYRTEVPALLETVFRLINPEIGIFIHAHLFRKDGQAEEMIEWFHANNWETYEVPHACFISESEMKDHPEWFKIRALISGHREKLASLARDHTEWVIFTVETSVVDAEELEDDSFFTFRHLFDSMMVTPNTGL
jgi:hypothetical protein